MNTQNQIEPRAPDLGHPLSLACWGKAVQRRTSSIRLLLIACAVWALVLTPRHSSGAEPTEPPPGWVETYGESAVWVDSAANWPEAEKKGLWPGAREGLSDGGTNVVNVEADVAASGTNEVGDLALAPIDVGQATRHDVSGSVDFLLGQGNTTIPIGVSLNQILPPASQVQEAVASPDRDSTYVGATLSYSYRQTWYLDLSYAHGDSSGNVDLAEISPGQTGDLDIKDDWFQATVRYAFPQLRGKKLSAYLQGGVNFIKSDMDLKTTVPQLGLYTQSNKADEIQGNLGFGVLYSLHTARRFRVGLQLEGEGFVGNRSQESLEILPNVTGNIPWTSVDLDTLVYGGLGRAAVRFEYGLGSRGLFKVFADGGVSVRYTLVDYSDVGETPDELLWGPYVKVGARYSF